MKKTFVIQVEYPDCDFVSSEEIAEVSQECIDQYLERYFGANIMDGDYDRIKVKEVTDFISLVKRMREAQKEVIGYTPLQIEKYRADWENALDSKTYLEREVDEYLEKFNENI